MSTFINVNCTCGMVLKAKPEHVGKKAKCPKCSQTLTVPDCQTGGPSAAIRVTCQCGKAFSAPPNLAGKRVKCPVCAQPLAIPNPGVQPDAWAEGDLPDDPLGLGNVATADPLGSDDGFLKSLDEMVDMEAHAAGLKRSDSAATPPQVGSAKQTNSNRNEVKSRRKSKRGGLSKVATGLNLMLIALTIKVGLNLVLLVVVGLLPGNAAHLVTRGVSFCLLAAGGLTLVGQYFCLSAPITSRTRNLLIPVLVIETGVFLSSGLEVIGIWSLGGMTAFSMLSPVLFLLFLKRLSRYVRFPQGDEDVKEIFQMVGIAVGLLVLPFFVLLILMLVPGLAGLGSVLFFVAPIGILIIALMILFKYIDLLASVRDRLRAMA